MKKIIIVLLFVFATPFCGTIVASDLKDSEIVSIPIQPGERDDDRNNNPKNIYISPISCYYSNGTFHFSFLEIFEDVTIRIENRSTGEQWYEFLDFTDSSTEIRTSSSAGTYVISIFTDDGYYSGILHK